MGTLNEYSQMAKPRDCMPIDWHLLSAVWSLLVKKMGMKWTHRMGVKMVKVPL